MGWVTDVAIGAVGSLIAAEIYCSAPRIARWMTIRAAARLPKHLRDRYEEEWLAYLEEWNGNLGKLWASLGFIWSSEAFLNEWRLANNPRNTRHRRFLFRANLWLYANHVWCQFQLRWFPPAAIMFLVMTKFVDRSLYEEMKEVALRRKPELTHVQRARRRARICNIVRAMLRN